MTRRRTRTVATRLAASIVFVPLALGACSGGDGDLPSALAGGGSGQSGGTSEHGDRPGQAPPAPEDVAGTVEDAIAATRSVRSADLSTLVSLGTVSGYTAGFEGEMATDGTSHLRGGSTDDTEVEVRSDGETAWVRIDSPEASAELPEGARWVRVAHEELREADAIQDLQATWSLLPLLRGIESFEDRGVEEVEGVPVRMLRGAVDLDAALAAASPEERSALEEGFVIDGEVESFVATVGLDGDSRVRSLELEVGVEGPVPDVTETIRVDLEVRAFNQRVEAPALPPEDETVDADEVPEIVDLLAESL